MFPLRTTTFATGTIPISIHTHKRPLRVDGEVRNFKPKTAYPSLEAHISDKKPLPISRIPMIMEPPRHITSSPSTLMLTSGASGRINALLSLRAMKSLSMLIHAFILILLTPFRGRKRAVASAAVAAAEKSRDERIESVGGHRKVGPAVRVPASVLPWRAAAVAVEQEVAARRALAKRRVMQDDDDNVIREFSLFNTVRGDNLFTQSWRPVNAQIRGVVILLHGLNEHSGRYSDFAKKLNANGFKVYGMDWIGHGGSDGLHAYVPSLDDAVCDLKSFIERVSADNPGLPSFCFGHSTGAAIILKAALDPKVKALISGMVLTSPAVGVQPSHPIYAILAPIVAFLLPRYQVGAANKKGTVVSRDPAALVAKYSDPLVYTGSIRVRTGYEILRITSYLQQNLRKLRVPFLVLHGTADRVTDPDASLKLYEEASVTDKTIKLLEGHLHDLLFEPEPEREAVERDIIDWLSSRVEW